MLLSEASVHSEMVLGEVRLAHRRRRQDGRPAILPIRVGYEGPLNYELDCYLARVQYARWSEERDSETVLRAVIEGAVPSQDEPPPPAPGDDRRRPAPGIDLRVLRVPPGGTIRLDNPFYICRPADQLVLEAAERTGETLVIKAPRQVGKSSLLVRYVAACAEAGKLRALLDFQVFSDGDLDSYAGLLRRIADLILRALRLPRPEGTAIESQADFIGFVEDHVLARLDGPLTLAFDEVDRLLGRPYQQDFFSMLRLWHNRRAEPQSPWSEVDLALVIATEPYLLISSQDRSPFNVTPPVEPKPFDRARLDELNDRYGGMLGAAELNDLHELLCGHPFLTRLAFYRLVTGEPDSFGELYQRAAEPDGPFGDHLRAMLMLIQPQPGLVDAMRQVVLHGLTPGDETYYRLHGAGLVRRDGNRVVPASLLYARFFKLLQ